MYIRTHISDLDLMHADWDAAICSCGMPVTEDQFHIDNHDNSSPLRSSVFSDQGDIFDEVQMALPLGVQNVSILLQENPK